ncbi:rhodanese-like domain-containing protein [bacterium endosymbiont of Bathymodiolus sp. 5 South]|jgi:rhodanese-related sulfurtransferase|uniref:rhodanese-like domain-containing protein n=1 Tax=bacterium endosymbiont of Bathymodiolus sp. 5 South TaxID=1181670 RepID=UPI0010B8430E|nr:rhodanese-like domain-containing protein [bacterium endosymbiont of Bathymodiolus sp. 5 South]CAC9460130.1 Rhodanese-related sulfurtransferase [uncultured Gammaproteobacteria bacterium]SHN92350.1 Rhodanese-related sulfurtransferase [bacterium endosymbiont of Bathymodiolus sp. 5 South]SSC07218.1 Rhodanese-related sulfurtransferase [bacterium endosymbiont of Bathymodiolus sp. 5 South]VVH59375.1 Rhodanese-related sulfurtransferase [uncultured Gammaproteobacteria bacterium]VVH61744.1 Rhodanese-
MTILAQYLPKNALERLKANKDAVLIDVRCEAENKFVGRPVDCIFVPWLDDPDWEANEDEFIAAIGRFNCQKDTEIILICRSGYRSGDAGKCLLKFGFTNVAHVVSGFEGDLDENNQRGNVNGWRHDGMPWLQC